MPDSTLTQTWINCCIFYSKRNQNQH